MAKKIDQRLADILKKYGADPAKDIWDCHGTWVAYHRTLEAIAATAAITFDPPTVIESDSASNVVAICVTGRMGDKAEWSFGEATPKNNKNAYPYAMAEKRAKDRVIIKLVGLHGLYSEDEADDFKPQPTASASPPADTTPFDGPTAREVYMGMAEKAIAATNSGDDLRAWWKSESQNRRDADLTQADVDDLKAILLARVGELEKPQPLLMAG